MKFYCYCYGVGRLDGNLWGRIVVIGYGNYGGFFVVLFVFFCDFGIVFMLFVFVLVWFVVVIRLMLVEFCWFRMICGVDCFLRVVYVLESR